MLPCLSRGMRLALVLSASVGYVALHDPSSAYADDDDDDDDDGGRDGDGDGDEEEEDAKDQPPVTAGGLFTLKTYPIREIFRPLTITQQVTQLRAGIGTDISNKGAFESAGINLEALHGLKDNFMIVGGLTSAYNFAQFGLYGGFEGALAYDVVDFRLAARLGRSAISTPDVMDPDRLNISSGDMKFSLDIGFPFRYAARPEIAIIALNTLMSIDFNSANCADDGMGGEICANSVKPDLNPSLGMITNPVAPLSVVVFAQLQVVDFDFTNNLKVPATIRIQFSPNQKFDIGGEFTLLNLKPAEGEGGPFDNRFLTLFIASRFGK